MMQSASKVWVVFHQVCSGLLLCAALLWELCSACSLNTCAWIAPDGARIASVAVGQGCVRFGKRG